MLRKFKTKQDLMDIVVGLDFDGTCVTHEHPYVGTDIGAIPVINRLIKEFNAKIVLNTMRSGKYLEDALKWFKDNNINLYGINNNPDQNEWTTSPKVFADLYIDDLNIGIPLIYSNICEKPHVDWKEVEKMLFGDIDESNKIKKYASSSLLQK